MIHIVFAMELLTHNDRIKHKLLIEKIIRLNIVFGSGIFICHNSSYVCVNIMLNSHTFNVFRNWKIYNLSQLMFIPAQKVTSLDLKKVFMETMDSNTVITISFAFVNNLVYNMTSFITKWFKNTNHDVIQGIILIDSIIVRWKG